MLYNELGIHVLQKVKSYTEEKDQILYLNLFTKTVSLTLLL